MTPRTLISLTVLALVASAACDSDGASNTPADVTGGDTSALEDTTAPSDAPSTDGTTDGTTIPALQAGGDPAGCADGQLVRAESVTVRGAVVTVGEHDVASDLVGYYLSDGSQDPLSGIHLVVPRADAVSLAVGDRVDVVGEHGEYFCKTQIAAESVEKTGTASVPPPVQLDKGLSASELEPWEGVVVELTDVAITGLDSFGQGETDAGLLIDDAVFAELEIPDGATLATARGVITYAFGTYRLSPRGPADLTVAAPNATVESVEISDLEATGFDALVTASGDFDEIGVVLGTSPNPTRGDALEFSAEGGVSGLVPIGVSSLEPSTTYFVRGFAASGGGTIYGDPQTVATPFLAKGDRYRGAVVVHVEGGETALLAMQFPTDEPELPFGCLGVELAGGHVGGIGGGGANTVTLVDACGAGTAAAFCADLVTGTDDRVISDWHLPNIQELQRVVSQFGSSLGGRELWSSTWVTGSGFAKLWSGVSGAVSDRSRGQANRVRCVAYYP